METLPDFCHSPFLWPLLGPCLGKRPISQVELVLPEGRCFRGVGRILQVSEEWGLRFWEMVTTHLPPISAGDLLSQRPGSRTPILQMRI